MSISSEKLRKVLHPIQIDTMHFRFKPRRNPGSQSQHRSVNRTAVKSVVNAGEEKISGGKLIKWLRNSAPTQYQELSDIIFRNPVDWISLAIKYRVVLVHKGDLPELYGMRVPLRPRSPPFTARDIEPPKMPHGEDVRDYVRSFANKLHDFLEITLPYIPNVKIELVDFRKFSSDTV